MFHNNNETNYINEQCLYCGEGFNNTEDIRVDIETDEYLCCECAEYHKIKTSECKEY